MKTCPICEKSWPSNHANCPTDGALLIDSRELEPGTVIRGKYRIVRQLGRGGMGTVYLAEHILLNRPRALKFISSELSQDAAFLRRFRREAQAAIELRHPNVVEVVDLDQAEDGSPYIAMEYVEGPDLRHALADGAFPVPRALAIARGIALGLGAAHAKGIIHRDVKPENILLAGSEGKPETPKLLDFGIAAMKETATAVSRTHGLMLTPPYAAPEQWKGMAAEELDGRTDLYALGGLLYEMLTGQTPFHAHNTEGWMYQHLHEQPQPPSTLRPELADWSSLDALVLRLLAKNREQRPRDAAELVGLLDAVRYMAPSARRKTVAEELSTIVVEKTVCPDARPMTQLEPQPVLSGERVAEGMIRPHKGRAKTGLIMAALLIVAAAGLAAWLIWGRHPAQSPAAEQSTSSGGSLCTAFPVDHPNQSETASFLPVEPEFIQKMGLKVLAGRGFTTADQAGSTAVIVINVTAANRWWPRESAIGHSIRINNQRNWLVVGVVLDADGQAPADSQGRIIYALHAQVYEQGQIGAGDARAPQAAPVAPPPAPADGTQSDVLTWTDPATSLMWTKKDNGKDVNWQQATDYCRNLQLAGHSDWRLPTIDELQGIYDANAGGRNVKGKLQLSSWWEWSSSSGNASGEAVILTFASGRGYSDPIGYSSHERALCVRGSASKSPTPAVNPAPVTPPPAPAGGTQSDALTWTDPATGIMWTKKDNGSNVNWQQATDYCRNLRLAGHSNWRLPAINELQGIYDPNANVGGYHVKSNLQLSNWWHWSSSPGSASGEAWDFLFLNGTRNSLLLDFGADHRALCVRRSGE